MARPGIDSRRGSPDPDSFLTAAVLDRPAAKTAPSKTKDRLQEEILRLTVAIEQGQLGERARSDMFSGGDRIMVEALNGMLDTVIGPLKMVGNCVEHISKGEVPAKITDGYNGEFNEIKNHVNACIDGMAGLLESSAVLQKMAVNDYTAEVEGRYLGVFAELATAVNTTQKRIRHMASTVSNIAQGQLGELPEYRKIGRRSEHDALVPALTLLMENLLALVDDTDMLAKAAVEGKLDNRADAGKHHGDYGKIVGGVNATLDAVVGPLRIAAGYVDRIAKGEIPPKITDTYNGDFNVIKNNLNACIDGLGGLVEANSVLQRMAVNDHSKAVEGHYSGIFAEVATATNDTRTRIVHLRESLKRISHGDLTELPEYKKVGRRCEHDELMPTVILMMDNLVGLIADTEALVQAAAEGKLGARADVSKHEGDFRKIVDGINKTLDTVIEPLKVTAQNAGTLASSSEELTAVSQQMAGNAEETAVQANVVSAASEQVSRNVSSVASASEQMQASIREIAKNSNESARVAKNAVIVAHSTNETVKKLGESSQEIGNVIKVITSIAQQTNLLALNATIEAARAGEAGKGFAVVANEVKELAKQTAKATEEIGQKIEAIQGDTNGAVKAIEEIGTIINQINDISNSIASAVEEQTVTTNEIGRSVAEAAKGVGDIAKNIGGVAVAAKNTTQGANDTQKAAQELSQMAAQLQTVISKFTF